jgi:Ca2+-transporting ATPase
VTADSPPAEPWASTANEVARGLGVDPRHGLSADEVARRREEHGRNLLRHLSRRSIIIMLVDQFRSLLVALLTAACVVAVVFGEWVEAGAIVAVLLINALLGFVTELQAERSMEALRAMGTTRSTVRRNGQVERIPAEDLVPGDVVLLEGGDVVTADLRLVEASRLQANESALTGESEPVGKRIDPVARDAPLADRKSMLFKGTVVTRGSGEALVVATGMQSELGKISQLVQEAKEEITPLEKRLNRLGQGLVWVTLVLATLVAITGYIGGRSLFVVIETAIALAVAAVPEGLPIIATIALARGMHRMADHRALVNRLSAVETLGATDILCTDKTGTLTENEMRVAELEVIDGEGARTRALEIGALCNNATLNHRGDGVGDPLEVALLLAARDSGLDLRALRERWPERREIAFDSEAKMMGTVQGAEAPFRATVKGAPEAVLPLCVLDAGTREAWTERAEQLANRGLRVLALAERPVDRIEDEVYRELELVGFVGMRDPPRVEVRPTIEACRGAGMRVVMVTGDHPVTARSIALATGLVDDPDADVVLGGELEGAGVLEGEARERMLDARIFARVSPKQKLDLVAVHQSAGHIVAMTGDGVNDAPALRKADIGVAMGQRGTEAAKEAAAMVLEDDDLSTLLIAIAEGRTIFDNIRKFVVYLLSCNISEVLTVGFAVALGWPLPLLPLHILFLNLVTDVFPALALGAGEGARDILERPPRAPDEAVVTRRHWRLIVRHGITMTACVLGAYALALYRFDVGEEAAATVAFLTLGFAQLAHVFNMQAAGTSVFVNEVTRNRWIWAALGLCSFLLLSTVFVPPLSDLLHIRSPSLSLAGVIASLSLAPLVIGQLLSFVTGASSDPGPAGGERLDPRRDAPKSA